MSAKHTPGPWKINRLAGILGAVVGGVVRKHPNGSSQDQLFMVCGCRDDNGGDEAQEANARLIAAAPELLDALNGLLIRVADDEEYGPDHAITIARAAIAKAIG